MTINSNTQSFSSLNGAIKVTQIAQSESSSTIQTKKLTDSVSVNINSNTEPLKEETVIQARNGYVNPELEARIKILNDYYPKIIEENNQFENPYTHIWDKYYNTYSPYYIEGLTKEERNAAHSNEFDFQRWGKDNGSHDFRDPMFRNRDNSSFYDDVDVASRKAFDREKVNGQFKSLLNKYNISIPQDTKLSFTIDPNTLKATVIGTDDETLAKSIEDVINTADNAKQLFLHISSSISDDSSQYNAESSSKYGLVQNIKDVTGYNLKDLEIKDGKFVTEDGTDVFQIYAKKINENPNKSDFVKQMTIASYGERLSELAQNGFDSVPDLVLSIDYQNGSFYDVKQSENFGTEKSGWINELKQARKNEELAHKGEEYESQYLDTTQFTKKYNDIDLTSKKNTIKNDEQHILSKDELMLKYLLGYEKETKNEDINTLAEKLKKMNEKNKIDNNIS
ncbi:hypothetical protein CKA55_12135 [Arcobacter suis]|uniref:DUF4885 domain-containing protein n=1 Tax=Arcobacter suis CECT 7833 TaxID=663365 RepID=A0AAD0SSV2_9BACT|nr:DUF4885 family protein [Arcobacter suis]AXX90559.1 DUF4885 domain-containing protein [Arcobacter suis CECT 7833]RWS45571.1 hypothetical protein CKA55_12135 [Arcobacter suis]